MAVGDESALEELYARYAGLVYALCRRILNDAHDAEALTGDIFFELWNRSPQYDPARSVVLTYITQLTRSRAIDRLRSSRTIKAGVKPDSLDDIAFDIADTTVTDPAHRLVSTERRASLQSAIAALSPQQREVLELAYFGGLTHQQIAQQVGKPIGTIKTNIRRALLSLQGSIHLLTA